jgi:ubiquinone/menaquinone biosynthesis C-methylase UbiE
LTLPGLTQGRRSGPALARADATRIPFRSRTFDIVTSFDMLQCVVDHGAAVREVARVLKPGGSFVGTVAALEILHGDHSVLSEEVRRYTRDEVTALLHGAGLAPVHVEYAFASIFPVMLAVRTLQRARGARAEGREITVPPAPINAALTALLRTEAALARVVRMPLGSSIVFLAQKRTTPPK